MYAVAIVLCGDRGLKLLVQSFYFLQATACSDRQLGRSRIKTLLLVNCKADNCLAIALFYSDIYQHGSEMRSWSASIFFRQS